MLQMSTNSQMTELHENSSLICGKDPVYYTNTIGVVVDWVILLVGLPEVCLASYALLRILKRDKAAPVFSINLLLSDLIQIGITGVFVISRFFDATFQPLVRARCIARLFVRLALTSSLGFMLLISAERYFMVTYAVWYYAHNTKKKSLLISLFVWIISLTYSVLDYIFLVNTRFSLLLFSIICFLPAPFIIAFFTATWKSLNSSLAMQQNRENKRKILGVLGLVMATYLLLFVPFSFRNLHYCLKGDMAADTEDPVRDLSGVLTSALVYLSPLVDGFIYIFIRKDIRDTVEAFPCCKTHLMKFIRSGTSDTSL